MFNNIIKQIFAMNRGNVFLERKVHIVEDLFCILLGFEFLSAKYFLTMAIHMDGPDIWLGVF